MKDLEAPSASELRSLYFIDKLFSLDKIQHTYEKYSRTDSLVYGYFGGNSYDNSLYAMLQRHYNKLITVKVLKSCERFLMEVMGLKKYETYDFYDTFDILFPHGANISHVRHVSDFLTLIELYERYQYPETDKLIHTKTTSKETARKVEKVKAKNSVVTKNDKIEVVKDDKTEIEKNKKLLESFGCSGPSCDGVCMNFECQGSNTNQLKKREMSLVAEGFLFVFEPIILFVFDFLMMFTKIVKK